MCGIAGIISPNINSKYPAVLQRMADSLAHRGPDGEGFWMNDEMTTGLAHRRLAIIDLSDAAVQPMHYLNRYTIVYNGEIYNYIELRSELQKAGYRFASQSDTEVILAAFDCYGMRCLQYFDGMFAFAIWDQKDRKLFAARDRMGEKPFYFHHNKDLFIFGSEMKALWAAGVPRQAENKMLLNYLTLGYVQNPVDKSQTFFSNISSLLPSHYLVFNANTSKFIVNRYWDIDKETVSKLPEEKMMQEFERLFNNSVAKRLHSDVPVGASLSGGLDSSSIAYTIMQQLQTANAAPGFKTFSAVFPGFEKDEQRYIDEVANQCSFKNFKVTPTAEGLINDFEKLCYHQEEPFPSSSIYAQYKVFELAAKNNIKVMIDGQGADEVLAGYHRYLHWYLQELVSKNKFLKLRSERQQFARHQMPLKWGLYNLLAAYLPSHVSIALEKKEFNRIVHHPDISKNLMGVLKGREWDGIHKPIINKLNDILYFSTMEHGLEELLRFSDRNSMAHGTEVRLPFLNAELVQFIFSMPADCKIRGGYTKYVLRKSMDHKLPDNIVWRTDKIGYEPPQKSWMGQVMMNDYIHEAKKKLVNADLLKTQVLDKKVVARHAHEADNADWRYMCVARML